MLMDNTQRRRKEGERDARVAALYESFPELQAIDHAQAQNALQLLRLIGQGASPEALRHVEAEAAVLRKSRQAFLKEAAIDPSVFEPNWDCPLCEDRGHRQGRPCVCQQEVRAGARLQASGLPEKLQDMTFENFDPSVFLDGDDIAQKLARLREFCRALTEQETIGNLILTGPVGRGKTHLAAAVANCVLEHGGRVRYWRVDEFLDALRQVKFNEITSAEAAFYKDMREVELVVLDDLGAESMTEFSLNQLQRLIEERNLNNKSWIVCTNLGIQQIQDIYDERLADRLIEKTTIFRLESPRSYRERQKPDDVRLI